MPAAPPRRRGVLALLTGDLPYHPYDAATVSAMRERGTRRNRRRSRRADDDAEGGQRTGSAPATVGGGEYDPSSCEFTWVTCDTVLTGTTEGFADFSDAVSKEESCECK